VPKKFEPIPKVGKNYYVFEDGKIKESRRFKVHITHIAPFNCNGTFVKRLRKEWKSFMNDCPWIHNLETDVFIRGYDEDGDEVAFARSGAGWYSFIGNCRLDVTGKLSKSMLRYLK
jgi:putative IMPACT (imprinted ancient) family translation regulator